MFRQNLAENSSRYEFPIGLPTEIPKLEPRQFLIRLVHPVTQNGEWIACVNIVVASLEKSLLHLFPNLGAVLGAGEQSRNVLSKISQDSHRPIELRVFSKTRRVAYVADIAIHDRSHV